MREYFIICYAKDGIYLDMTPFELTLGSINDVANLAPRSR